MFQLIIAVVAIALVTILGIAMIFFGGSVFGTGTDRALYAQLMNHGSQIEGAMKLYSSDYGNYPIGTSSQQLQSLMNQNTAGQTYLSTIPQGSWYIDQGVIYRQLSDPDQCIRVNVAAKMPDAKTVGCPSCSDANYSQWPGCQRDQIPN